MLPTRDSSACQFEAGQITNVMIGNDVLENYWQPLVNWFCKTWVRTVINGKTLVQHELL